MTPQNLQRNLRSARKARNVAFIGFAFLLVVNGFLATTIATQSNQVVLIPTNVSDGMVARGATDKRYIEAIALDTAYALYNVSPSNVDYGRQVIERVTSVAQRPSLLKRYDEISQDIIERKISTIFYPEKIEHNPNSLEVRLSGRLHTYLNTVMVSSEKRAVLVGFSLEAGSVRVTRVNRLEVEE